MEMIFNFKKEEVKIVISLSVGCRSLISANADSAKYDPVQKKLHFEFSRLSTLELLGLALLCFAKLCRLVL